jgi:phospholipid transport system substrate-binding protein
MEKTMNRLNLIITALFFSASFSISAHAENTHPAHVIVKDTVQQVIAALDTRQDKNQVSTVINDIIIPRFDFTTMSRSVLGNHWDKLDDSRKEMFVKHFQQSLVNTYASSLTEFDSQSIEVLAARQGRNANYAAVPTRIMLNDSNPVVINYLMLQDEEQNEWRVVDVSFSGVSLIKNYRATYASEIGRVGFDGLMQKLIDKNKLAAL